MPDEILGSQSLSLEKHGFECGIGTGRSEKLPYGETFPGRCRMAVK